MSEQRMHEDHPRTECAYAKCGWGPWPASMTSQEREADQAALADQRRREWIGKLLELASADPYAKIGTWEDLVKIAMEYGGRAVPRPAGVEFEAFREKYAHLPGRDEIRLTQHADASNGARLEDAVRLAQDGKRTLVTDHSGRKIAAIVPAWLAGSGEWACGCPASSTGEHRPGCPRYPVPVGLLTLGELRDRLTRTGNQDWDLSTPREELERLLEAAEAEMR
jgi:hypothetical protein